MKSYEVKPGSQESAELADRIEEGYFRDRGLAILERDAVLRAISYLIVLKSNADRDRDLILAGYVSETIETLEKSLE
jgi:hypothetical protein